MAVVESYPNLKADQQYSTSRENIPLLKTASEQKLFIITMQRITIPLSKLSRIIFWRISPTLKKNLISKLKQELKKPLKYSNNG
jgi:hypothetical protein